MNVIHDQHKEMVAKLAKDGRDISFELSPQAADLWHHVTGVVTETGELWDFKGEGNLVEELGDMEFYLCGVRTNLGIDWVEEPEIDGMLPDNFAWLMYWATELLDATKKVVIYGQEPDRERFGSILFCIERRLAEIRAFHGVLRDDTLVANMAKLAKRYPGFNYTDQRAAERADKVRM